MAGIWIIAERKANAVTEGTLEAIGAGRVVSGKLKITHNSYSWKWSGFIAGKLP